MKCLESISILLFLSIISVHTYAQDKRPVVNEPNYNLKKAFTDLPSRMNMKIADAESILELPVGSSVNAMLATNFRAVGTVVSKSDATDVSVKTVVVKLTNRGGATFTFTRRTKDDGSFTYLGRIMNRSNGDAYDLVKENSGYVLVKKSVYELYSE